ncbi:hypothetical protein B0H16DRAFT_1531783 [Mycena metata]|uniref:Uncharacterized protein n=1 Tax=Mycena metata TaxID=1033252 RepID=A0AAD7JBA9_9AGAR|nr:hypothetical protein B0H16DRAFT_1531783 [Mycena metata]
MAAGMGRFGYLDIFLCGLLGLHPERVVAIELKYISIRNLYRALCKTDKECEDLVRGTKPPSTFRQQCRKKIREINRMTIAELRNVKYHFSSYDRKTDRWVNNRAPISTMLDKAQNQLEAYMNAIVNGAAFQTNDGSDPEGITAAETRVAVTKAPKGHADELFGIIVVGIGRRIIALVREPKKQNTKYRYAGVPGWQDIYEREP